EQREKLVVCHGGTLLRTLDAVADEVTGRVEVHKSVGRRHRAPLLLADVDHGDRREQCVESMLPAFYELCPDLERFVRVARTARLPDPAGDWNDGVGRRMICEQPKQSLARERQVDGAAPD